MGLRSDGEKWKMRFRRARDETGRGADRPTGRGSWSTRDTMSSRCESTGLDPLEENQESGSDGGGQYRRNVAILPDL